MSKIAIIGGGIAGLTAAYLLNPIHQIKLFEKQERLGGNAFTHTLNNGIKVDIAVAAFSKAGYNNFYKLLDKLKIKTALNLKAYMTLYNLDTKEGLYITPLSLKGLIDQKFALFNPSNAKEFLKLLKGINKAILLFNNGELKNKKFKEMLELIPELSSGNSRLLLLSALCLMSSMFAEEIMESPAEFFISKLKKHNDVISPKALYSVRTIKNKTESYVNAMAETFKDKIVTNSKIEKVIREDGKVILISENNKKEIFDKVIFACNADQALDLLDNPTEEEKNLLGKWKYKEGEIVVHKDYTYFPKRSLMQAYNFLYTDRDGKFHTSVSGGLWYESNVPDNCEYISSQHPNFPIKDELIDYKTVLRTPIYDFDSYPTIDKLPSLNGKNNSYYCGSHFGHGLHEAAVTSAINVAKMLGAEWE